MAGIFVSQSLRPGVGKVLVTRINFAGEIMRFFSEIKNLRTNIFRNHKLDGRRIRGIRLVVEFAILDIRTMAIAGYHDFIMAGLRTRKIQLKADGRCRLLAVDSGAQCEGH